MYQTSLFDEHLRAIPVRASEDLDPDAVRIAVMVYVAAETFKHICLDGELDFVSWKRRLVKRLTDQKIEADEDEVEWLQARLLDQPRIKAGDGSARRRLNARLATEPALPSGATVALFMKGSIKRSVAQFGPAHGREPTALIILTEPLHFVCERGAIFEIRESPVVAQVEARTIPGWTGTSPEEAERFILGSEADISMDGNRVLLKYPSLNKALPAIFHRLHVREGRQNTNRSIYHHAAWMNRDPDGRIEYYSLWGIRDGVRLHTWRCPQLGGVDRQPTNVSSTAFPEVEREPQFSFAAGSERLGARGGQRGFLGGK